MLVADDLHQSPFFQRCSNCVRTFSDFAPGGPGAKSDSLRLFNEAVVSTAIQNGAVGIGKQHQSVCSRDGSPQDPQFVVRQLHQDAVLFFAPLQFWLSQQIEAGKVARKSPMLPAALP